MKPPMNSDKPHLEFDLWITISQQRQFWFCYHLKTVDEINISFQQNEIGN